MEKELYLNLLLKILSGKVLTSQLYKRANRIPCGEVVRIFSGFPQRLLLVQVKERRTRNEKSGHKKRNQANV